MMNICRTCLKTSANKDISELEKSLKEDNKTYRDIMLFCLDIKVTEDSKITSNLCKECYRKIVSFYKFKLLSLKNDAYLKSMSPVVSIVDHKSSVYVDEEGIKHENFLDIDDYGPSLVEDDAEFKIEINLKNEESLAHKESDGGPIGVSQEVKLEYIINEEEKNSTINSGDKQCQPQNINIPSDSKEKKKKKQTSPTNKKRGCAKKAKQPKEQHSKQDYEMCEECGGSFRNLKEHIISHQPKEKRQMLQCKVCPKLFYTKRGQKYHYKTTHLGLKSRCDICGKEVVCLSVHKLQVHNPHAQRFGCVSCSRRFISQSALDIHLTSHTKVLAYECDFCHKKFRHKESIAQHMLVHMKQTRYQCEFCSKRFFRRHKLQDHLRSHTKERPYSCEECGKSFSLRGTLNSHRLTHGDVKKFRCGVCGVSFMKSGYLKAHMISHTKEKRHPCRYCGARFGRSDHRARHEFTAHQKLNGKHSRESQTS